MRTPDRSTLLFVGTRRGLFRFRSDSDRQSWQCDDLQIAGHEIYHATVDAVTGAGYAAASHPVWGSHIYRTDDFGETWAACDGRPRFPASLDREVRAVWHLAQGHAPQGVDRVYAGVEPAALFHSDDRGTTWMWNAELEEHPTRATWQPAKGGLALHSIQTRRDASGSLFVALSAGGCYRTSDFGQSWEAINRGVRADFLPEQRPESGQCVHSLRIHPGDPDRLYQQNHCGTYRSDDGGSSWIEITSGLPSDFGYVIGIDPADRDCCWVIPEESSHLRSVCDQRLRVFETRDGGSSWMERTDGLPQAQAWVTVLREALATDGADPCGVYFGTATGHLFASRDGKTWTVLAHHLPKILSVEACRIG
ncbi:MAG: hypothetical protein OEM23_03500 [Gemmatimonadota bacterium]|nr:hypothetical protein [Gemmatimonadota bacterium]MDH3427478.1 hypothetical protein [Gemmatimonadota bacterium]